jgi:hypothetical protein
MMRRHTLIIRLPFHPSLKHLTGTGDVLEQLLEVDELEPDLVDSRQEGDGSIIEVSGVLNVSGFQFLYIATTSTASGSEIVGQKRRKGSKKGGGRERTVSQ